MGVKITRENLKLLKESVNDTFASRRDSESRKDHERWWTETDRQVRLKPHEGVRKSGNPDEDWHNAIELGDMATASEVFVADVVRLMFGGDNYITVHTDLSDVDLEVNQKEKLQDKTDKEIRAFMLQQHQDFSLRQNVKVSLKEIAHHGSMVATVQEGSLVASPVVNGGRTINSLKAPVWRAHSMWNCFPDTNPGVVGTRSFYDGSMIVRSYIQEHQIKDQNWQNKKKILDNCKKNDRGDKTVEIITMYGPIFIPRKSGEDIYIPNGIVQIANNEIAMAMASDWPYPNLVYTGYERIDAKDPYYHSPLVKHAPMQILGSRCANKMLDGIDLKTEPPLGYNKNSPNFSEEAPQIAPGVQIPLGTTGDIKILDVGDPAAAQAGLEFAKNEIKIGVGVDSTRAGVEGSVEQTAQEIRLKNARSEVRTIDFLSDFEDQALKPFLYMQHEWNKNHLASYPYFNSEVGVEDHQVMTKSKINKNAIFKVTGSKDILGEEQRATRMIQVTQTVMSIEGFADRVDKDEIIKDMYKDAGAGKKAELYVKTRSEEDQEVVDQEIIARDQEIQALSEAAQQTEQQFQEQLQAAQQEVEKSKAENQKLTFSVQEQKSKTNQAQEQLAKKASELQQEKTEKQSLIEENRIAERERMFEKKVIKGLQDLQTKAMQNKEQSAAEREKTMGEINNLRGEVASAVAGGDQSNVVSLVEKIEKLAEAVSKPKNSSLEGDIGGKKFTATKVETT